MRMYFQYVRRATRILNPHVGPFNIRLKRACLKHGDVVNPVTWNGPAHFNTQVITGRLLLISKPSYLLTANCRDRDAG